MKTILIRVCLLTLLAFASTPFAGASLLLAGWYDFDGTSANEAPDETKAGFSGNLRKGGLVSLTNSGSDDGFYGNSDVSASAGNDGFVRALGATQFTIFSLSNNTQGVAGLDHLFFDARNTSQFTASYKIVGSPSPPVVILNTIAGAGIYQNFGVSLRYLGLALQPGETIDFIFNSVGGIRVDNLAITAIPEPAGIMALGFLLSSGLLIRSRRRSAAGIATA